MKESCPRVCHSTLLWMLVGALILIPPILLMGGAVIWSALQYDGTCPTALPNGLVGCSMEEHLRSGFLNPASILVHLYGVARWIGLGLIVVTVLGTAGCGQCSRLSLPGRSRSTRHTATPS